MGSDGKSSTLAYQKDWSDSIRRKVLLEMPHNDGRSSSCPVRDTWVALEPDPETDTLPSGKEAMKALKEHTGVVPKKEILATCCLPPAVFAPDEVVDGPLTWDGFETLFMSTDFLEPEPTPEDIAKAKAEAEAAAAALTAEAEAKKENEGKKGKGKKGKGKAEEEAPPPPPPPPPPPRGPPISFPGLPRVDRAAVGAVMKVNETAHERSVVKALVGLDLIRAAAHRNHRGTEQTALVEEP